MAQVSGGPAIPVSIAATLGRASGRAAIPVYGYNTQPTDRAVAGGPAMPVYVLSAAEVASGTFRMEGGPALPVWTSPGGIAVAGAPAQIVYAVNPTEWPTSTTPAAFAPMDIAGLKVWLKADALALNDAAPVATWTDSSGSGNNAAQAVAGAQPTYKVNIVNGKPVVRFDGTDDYMTIADNANYKTANITLFVVIKATNTGTTLIGYPHDVTHTNPYFRWLFYKYDATQLELRWNGTGAVNAAAMDSTNWFVLEEVDSDAYVNGTLKIDGTDADLTYPNAVGIYIGANSSAGELLAGDIAEILLYDSSLSAGNRSLVRAYLGTKYNITVV